MAALRKVKFLIMTGFQQRNDLTLQADRYRPTEQPLHLRLLLKVC